MTDAIKTRIGWADFGDYEHFGRRLYRDLAGSTSYVALVAFSLTGRVLSPSDAGLLDDVALAAHVPEPRVWPLKLARLVASCGRPVTGYLAGSVVLDGDYLGGDAVGAAAAHLLAVWTAVEHAPDLDVALHDYVRRRVPWPGIGVQQRKLDERVAALTASVERRGLAGRRYWSLSTKLWAIVQAEHGIALTIFEAMAAACLDASFTPAEIVALAPLLLQPQFLAHAFDGATQASPSLKKLPDDAVVYVGPPPRTT